LVLKQDFDGAKWDARNEVAEADHRIIAVEVDIDVDSVAHQLGQPYVMGMVLCNALVQGCKASNQSDVGLLFANVASDAQDHHQGHSFHATLLAGLVDDLLDRVSFDAIISR
jgi:hypothetical protein